MFDRLGVTGGSGGGRHPRVARADRVTAIRRAELRIEALVLRDAADWADQHGVDLDDPFATGPAGGVGRQVGSDGTPWIDEHLALEYGTLRGTSTHEATSLIIDALDLRHRFPRIWRAVHHLQVRVRFARRISAACRDLSREAAAAVDAELTSRAAWGLPWARLEKVLTAAIINADPARHQAKLDAARFDRRVWLSPDEDGLRTLVIRADQGDQILLHALIERIADILLADGDTDPADARRAKAAGWLARPEDLVVLLYRHATSAPAPTTSPAPGPAQHESATVQHGSATAQSGSATVQTAVVQSRPDDAADPQPPADFPDHDRGAVEPPWDPGVSDRLPPPPSRWLGTDHRPRPEPFPPAWAYQRDEDHPPDTGPPEQPPPPDPDPPGPRLGSDVPRLVDYLTAQGLKPARPRVVLHVHLTDQTLATGQGVVRSDDCGPILLAQLLTLLRDHHCQVSLRPVLDPAELAAVDAYEIPDALRTAVRTRHPASVFPFSSRTGRHLELDHTVPHTRTATGPPAQTRIGNLGPLAHVEHQAKTHGAWHVEQPHPGVFLWRSPHRHYFLVTNHGTQALGPMPTPRPTGLPDRPTVVRHQRRQHVSRRERRAANASTSPVGAPAHG